MSDSAATVSAVPAFEEIQAAARRIEGLAKRTPLMTSRGFDAIANTATYFKCENLQTGGAFKIRGAANFVLSIPEAERKRGVIAYSSGNHAQAVAIAAQSVGIHATLVMPKYAPQSKVEAARSRGARIILYDRFTEDRVGISKKLAEESGATTVPPFDHPWIMAGAGTLALEILEEAGELDAIVCPIGGGGMISGCAIAAKHLNPAISVIGVEPADANDTFLSLRAGHRVSIDPPPTIADGLRSPMPGELTFPVIQKHVDKVVLVSEDEIRETVKHLLMRLKILVEPSGAVSAAAVLFGKLPPGLRRVGVVLSGGNMDWGTLAGL
jgi:threonine dehydratase